MERRSEESSATPNGVGEPLQRLASFKGPRDLSLGGVKLSKKIFAPNLNVSRNKTKGPSDSVREKKEEKGKGKNRKNNDRHNRNGPTIIKSAGVFSEGLGASDRRLAGSGFGGGGMRAGARGGAGSGAGGKGDGNAMQKPTIRPGDTIKVDKEMEDECIRRAVGGDLLLTDEAKETRRDLPVKLPIADFRRLNVQRKRNAAVVIKQEPGLEDDLNVMAEQKPLLDVKAEPDAFEEKDIVSLMQSERPTLILVQLPDCMPGRGEGGEDVPTDAPPEELAEKARCRLSSLAEGRMGRLCVHRSGRVRLRIGDTSFEVIMGTKAMHHQEVVTVGVDPASRSARITSLGALHHKLTVVPDWETLLRATP